LPFPPFRFGGPGKCYDLLACLKVGNGTLGPSLCAAMLQQVEGFRGEQVLNRLATAGDLQQEMFAMEIDLGRGFDIGDHDSTAPYSSAKS
jgi:hypothetical protein